MRDRRGRVLIADRPAGKPWAGYWEFPGGKLETGEPQGAALQRELHEELGIAAQAAYRLFSFSHRYPERLVHLHVWRVTQYRGTAVSHEGQTLAWHDPETLRQVKLLPADQPILEALRLPPLMLVTPPPGDDEALFLRALGRSLEAGVDLVQFRAPELDADRFIRLGTEVVRICRQHGARVLINAEPAMARGLKPDGIHLRQDMLRTLESVDIDRSRLLGISCHSAEEIARALAFEPDYLTLGSVKSTASHPGGTNLGWEGFGELAATSGIPVYAIGGLGRDDLETARRHRGHGVAAIRAFWDIPQLSELS